MRRLLLVLVLGAVLAGSAAAATIRGTALGELLAGGEANDKVLARGGDDRIQVAFGGRDTVTCGAGRDLVVADGQDSVARDCELIVRRISHDNFRNPESQHETAVEPDSFAWGSTVVAAFQLGRVGEGGAAGIGWATSKDAGRTWRDGSLPSLTTGSNPPGSAIRASDPVVAYDAAHGVWLIASLTLSPGTSDLVLSRSRDGIHWSAPVVMVNGPALDKEWIACDNGTASRFRGRCYTAYTDGALRTMALQSSDDGGVTWSTPIELFGAPMIGAYPLISPDGTLTILFDYVSNSATGTMLSVRSEDGGVTLGAAQPVSRMQWRETSRMRALPLPSGAVDGAGNLYVAWHDCRFRAGCSANDIVVISSRDGITWSAPTRIAVDAPDAGSDHFVTGLDADPTATGKLAVVYAFFQPGSCAKGACLLDAGFSSSPDGGATWSPQVQLGAEGMSVEWIAQTTGGAMIGDYYSVSFAGGRVVPVFTLALPPVRGRLREAIFAASLVTAGVRRP